MVLPNKVKLIEVGPRDGLQNEKNFLSTDIKIAFIEKLCQTGVKHIEATSFVSPKAIPQLTDGDKVFSAVHQHYPDIEFSALVPNIKGLERALDVGVKHIALFAAASESFSQKNINCTIDESFKRFEEVIRLAKDNQLYIRAYLSCVVGCPYEGDINAAKVSELAKRFDALEVDEICLGDTIGVGTPKRCQALIEEVCTHIDVEHLAMHFHDTYGQALANIYASLEMGVATFDSSVAGLGGCPYAQGASGNVATEDVLYLLHGLGIETGIDLNKMIEVGNFISQALNRANFSKVANALGN